MPSASPPVTFWSGLLKPEARPTVRNAKSKLGVFDCAHCVATTIFLTGHAPSGRSPLWYSGTNSTLLAYDLLYTQWAAVMITFLLLLVTTLAVQKCLADPVV